MASNETVTVACKLPNGLRLRIFDMRKTQELVMGGGSRDVKQAFELPTAYTVYGNSHPQNAAPGCPILQGFALTHGIPKDFWDKWHEQNKTSDLVTRGLIFAHEKADVVNAQAEEKKAVRSNLERLDPNKLPKGIQRSDMMKDRGETMVA